MCVMLLIAMMDLKSAEFFTAQFGELAHEILLLLRKALRGNHFDVNH